VIAAARVESRRNRRRRDLGEINEGRDRTPLLRRHRCPLADRPTNDRPDGRRRCTCVNAEERCTRFELQTRYFFFGATTTR
jgi:hypothetical protein